MRDKPVWLRRLPSVQVLGDEHWSHSTLAVILCFPPQEEKTALQRARLLRQRRPGCFIVLLPTYGGQELLLGAVRAGVDDVILPNASQEEVDAVLQRIQFRAEPNMPLLLGDSAVMRRVRERIQHVAPTGSTVLITGETGTGKELAAELIHRESPRSGGPFVSLNCAAIPEALLESELFGYERGAFTGATSLREGKMKAADGGTIFLDEIGDMSLDAQAKILRAVETRQVQRLGGDRSLPVDVRIIAATNRDMAQMVEEKRFRADLYYRLNVINLQLPALREHPEDIELLLTVKLREIADTSGRGPCEVSLEALSQLQAHSWPGNVRELRNMAESCSALCLSGRIDSEDLPCTIRDLHLASEVTERERLLYALTSTEWNKSQAARKLNCSRMTLYRKMRKYRLGVVAPHKLAAS